MPVLALLILLAQPATQPTIVWDAPPAAKPEPQSDFDKALADSYAKKPAAGSLGFAPQTEEEKRAAANAAAIARAEQARQEASGAWPQSEKPKLKCRETSTGLVCGSSDRALDEQEQRLKERLDAMSKDD